ncbi:MAG: hypothetical protein WB609_08930 [Candidatus Cybelea sp.]
MQPQLVRQTTGDLIYAASSGDAIDILSYPEGRFIESFAPANTLSQQGLCSDSSGDVFVASLDGGKQGYVYEYAHGGSQPIQTFPEKQTWPFGCAVDSLTGNLAVSSINSVGGPGYVAIYKKATGAPTVYRDPEFSNYYFCGYDDKGNLFVDGTGGGDQIYLADLPKGSSSFSTFSLRKSITEPRQIQWDGKYISLAEQDKRSYELHRLSFSGSTATIVGTTKLRKWLAHGLVQSWIEGNAVLVPTGHVEGQLGFWHYPAAGRPTKKVPKLSGLLGVTISRAPHG